jgi:hypothetical protein
MEQLALDTEEPFYFIPHVATPLGLIPLAPIRVNDTSGWHGQALQELGKQWSAAAQFGYLATVQARSRIERGILCTLTWPG